jgi:hypothetical protein
MLRPFYTHRESPFLAGVVNKENSYPARIRSSVVDLAARRRTEWDSGLSKTQLQEHSRLLLYDNLYPCLNSIFVFEIGNSFHKAAPPPGKVLVVTFEVFMAVTMKSSVFWNVTPCGSCNNRCFGGMCRPYVQRRRNQRGRSKEWFSLLGASNVVPKGTW